MKLAIALIRETLEARLQNLGMDDEMAAITARDYLEGDLQGKFSHGLMAFPSFLESGLDYKGRKYKVEEKKNALIIVDANALPGLYVGQKIADELIEMAKTEGVATAFIKNMSTWLRPGTVAEYIADQHMIAFVINHGGKPMVAPPGGYDPILGTNPIGIGIPTKNQPILVDMASSKRAWGEVRKAKVDGLEVPENAFNASDGSVAKQPEEAYSAMPFGDYKGFALSLFIEIMTGSFLGREMSQNLAGDSVEKSDAYRVTRGGMIIVINSSLMTDLDKFKEANSALIEKITSSRSLPGSHEKIRIPGENAIRNREKCLEEGYLEVDDELWRKIKN